MGWQSAMVSNGAEGACALKRAEFLPAQHLRDGAQPVRALGMPQRRQMIQTGGMGDEQGGHADSI